MRLRTLLCTVVAAGALRAQDGNDIDVTVRVVGPTRCPLPGVQVGKAESAQPLGRTDASGALRVRLRRGEQIRVLDEVFAPAAEVLTTKGFVPVPIPTAKVTGAEVVLQCDEGVAGEVLFVDAETGVEIRDARWNAVDYESRSVEQGIVLSAPGSCGSIAVTPPAGYRLWQHDVGGESCAASGMPGLAGALRLGAMSYFARSVFAVVPLRKAVEIEVLVKDHKGKPATGVTVASVEVGGIRCDSPSAWDERITPGRVRLTVPHFREGRVSVRLRAKDASGNEAGGTWTTRLGWDYKAKLSGGIRLPEPVEPAPEEESYESGIGVVSGKPPLGVGKLVIRARRFDGSAGTGLPVRLRHREGELGATLDAEGRASFDTLIAGRWIVELSGAGFLGRRFTVDIAEDILEIDYDEPVGGRIEVSVVDRKDRPLPFAELALSKPKDQLWTGISWELDGGGFQRVDMFTDHAGRRTLVRLPPGELMVHARYGARAGTKVVAVASGETGRAKIVLDDEP